MTDVSTENMISKSKPASASMDYAALRAEGLAYIQSIASGTWTDHNIHDPGITILENLVYAITDLAARANRPIEDLLVTASQPTSQKDFFQAEEILPCSAVTIDDYRKLLIDLDPIRNAWLSKATSSEQQIYLDSTAKTLSYTTGDPIVLNGLYNVMLEFEEDEELGDLNNSIIITEIEILVSGNPVKHTIEVAFPFWDEISTAWKEDIILNSITLQDVPGFPGKKIRELASGLSYIFFAVMDITYNAIQTDQIGVTIQLTSKMEDPAIEIPLIETGIVNKLQDITAAGVVKGYNLKIVAANNILTQVKEFLYNNRNLSEDFFSFNATRIQEIGIKAELQVASDTNVEQTVAEMFFHLDQFLTPSIHFYSLDEMLAMGKAVDEIFNGPLLINGFIPDEELTELIRDDVIYTSDLIRVIMDLNGDANVTQPSFSAQRKTIISVYNLTITNYINNQAITSNVRNCLGLTLIDVYKPKLSVGKSVIKVIRDNDEVNYSRKTVAGIFNALKDAQILNSKTPVTKSILSVPSGNYLNVENYYSIQNDFPQTYGIGHAGLPNTTSNERKAQAKQLKAYLLVFEQLMADYLSQLSHIKELFSIDAGVNDTYFWQPLTTVPRVTPLLKASYATAIPDLLKKLEQSAPGGIRRLKFLDHLLGQFGEDLTDLASLMYAKFNGASTNELIKDKSIFLKEYATLSYHRAKSFNYQGEAWDTDNVSWLKKRICRLLGIESYGQKNIAGDVEEGFHVVEHILLRPQVNDSISGVADAFLGVDLDADLNIITSKKDPYSFRLSFVFPNWTGRFGDADFRKYTEKIIQRETPAHILAEIYWLDETAIQNFEQAFKAWLIAMATETDPLLITPAKNDLVTFLNSL